MALSKTTIQVVKDTAPVIAPLANKITSLFYKNMFRNSPEVLKFFNQANSASGRQPAALAHAVVAYASNIENLDVLGPAVETMAVKHCGLQVLPEHYPTVEKNLMLTVGEVLGDALTPQIGAAWTDAVQFLSQVLITREEELYKAAEERNGGWRGWQPFTLAERISIADDTALFTFNRSNGNTSPFSFTPGQFMTLRSPAVQAPRHYTIVSPPGETYLQCAVKFVSGGQMSTYLHNKIQVGDTVKISPPFGNFTANNERDAVLISAGVGITPMIAFQKSLGDHVKKIIHVDKTSKHHAFVDFQNTAKCERKYFYTKEGVAPYCHDMNEIADVATIDVGKNTMFYVCAPTAFMKDIEESLRAKGFSNIHYEAFGPQMAPHAAM